MTLRAFLSASIVKLDHAAPEERLALFLALRYDVLNRLFPHPIFSVSEATPDFFRQTLAYLAYPSDIPPITPNDRPFRANYLQWVKTQAEQL